MGLKCSRKCGTPQTESITKSEGIKFMKKLSVTILIVLFTATLSLAQPGGGQGMARIHAAKMAYIADRLHLSSNQSYGFVPLYNDYERELRETRQFFFKKY